MADPLSMDPDRLFSSALPPEYEEKLRQLRLRQQMAQGLLGISGPQPTQVVSGFAVRQSPFEHVSRMLGNALGAYMQNKVQGEIGGVQKQYQTDLMNQMQGIAQAPAAQQAAMALSSGIPGIRAWGQKLQQQDYERQQKEIDRDLTRRGQDITSRGQDLEGQRAAGQLMGSFGDLKGGLAALGGRNPNLDTYQPPTPKAPSFGRAPDGTPLVVNYDIKGTPHATLGQVTRINNTIPGLEYTAGLRSLEKGLDTREEAAKEAKGTVQAVSQAIEALNSGAKTGGLQSYKQALRKVGQGFGIDAPDTASTEQLNMALGQGVLAKAKTLAPVTENDVQMLQDIVGSINTDPLALRKALSLYGQIANRTLTNFQKYTNSQSQQLENPIARDLFRNRGIGYEPQAVPEIKAPNAAKPALRYNPYTGKLEPQ